MLRPVLVWLGDLGDQGVGAGPLLVDADGRQSLVGAYVIVHRQSDLFEIVRTLRSSGRFTRRLNGWQEQRMRTAMMAITTSSSTKVKPRNLRLMFNASRK